MSEDNNSNHNKNENDEPPPPSTSNGPTLSEAERNLRKHPTTEDSHPVYRFVFTGGPCGGKTTALARVFSYLRERGFQVITCPEAYTILASNGMSGDFFSTPGMDVVIQQTVLDVQTALEDGVYRVLKARGKPGVMLCDRGSMDGSVYLGTEAFERILQARGTDVVEIRDSRYDAVFHLVSAADGAEMYYTLDNNKVRSENPAQARALDTITQRAWTGHPHLYCIDNSTDFEGKMTRLVDIISKIVGLPSNLKRRSAKFLLAQPPDLSIFPPEIHYELFEVEKIYLMPQDGDDKNHSSKIDGTPTPQSETVKGSGATDNYSFIRRRSNIDRRVVVLGSVYQLTTVQRRNDEWIERKRIISQREYQTSSLARDQGRHVVRQRRISFLHERQSFVVHVYQSPAEGLCILHAQVEASAAGEYPTVKLPPFLNVDRRLENTKEDEERYGAYNLSLIRK